MMRSKLTRLRLLSQTAISSHKSGAHKSIVTCGKTSKGCCMLTDQKKKDSREQLNSQSASTLISEIPEQHNSISLKKSIKTLKASGANNSSPKNLSFNTNVQDFSQQNISNEKAAENLNKSFLNSFTSNSKDPGSPENITCLKTTQGLDTNINDQTCKANVEESNTHDLTYSQNEIENTECTNLHLTFEDLGLCEELCLKCAALNWTKPTPIQAQSLIYTLKGHDVIGLAETGSGKTASFVLPILQKLLNEPDHHGVYALVLAPTRELSVQIAQQFQALGSDLCLKTCVIYGGVDMVAQAMEIAKKPHVIIATPGRLMDHLQNTKGFHLSSIKFLVLDEADRLLSLDFEESLNQLLEILPVKRQTLLFSATMTDRVSKLQKASLKSPVKVHVNEKYDTVKDLVQNMKLIPLQYKLTYLCAFLLHTKQYISMIFVNTCLEAQKIAACLRHLRFSSICLHGKMAQHQRLAALNQFKAESKRILVTTEVGSRGLDISSVDIVINFDVPHTSKDYIHRVGRTARAGRTGRSLTLVTPYDIEEFQQIELATKKKMEPYQDLKDEDWKIFHEQVEEARLLTEREMRELQKNPKSISANAKRENVRKKPRFNHRK